MPYITYMTYLANVAIYFMLLLLAANLGCFIGQSRCVGGEVTPSCAIFDMPNNRHNRHPECETELKEIENEMFPLLFLLLFLLENKILNEGRMI